MENDSNKFQNTLKDKISSLQMNPKDKEKILKSFTKNTESSLDKLEKKNKLDNTSKNPFYFIPGGMIPNTRTSSNFNTLESANKTGNNGFVTGNAFNSYNSMSSTFNKLSETKNEFSKERAEKISFRRKERLDTHEIDPTVYNANTHREVFCEHYNTYGGIFEKKEDYEIKDYQTFYKEGIPNTKILSMPYLK